VFVLGSIEFAHMPETTLIGFPWGETLRLLAHGASLFGVSHNRVDTSRHCDGDFVLDREDLIDITIVAFRPDVIACLRVNKLRGNANPVATSAHTAFDHVAHA
jgi:hypothetical protein